MSNSQSLFTYGGDYVRNPVTGVVGQIVESQNKYSWGHATFKIRWINGNVSNHLYYEVEYIRDYDYFLIVDPDRCPPEALLLEKEECYFTGEMVRVRLAPKKISNEDLF